MKKLRYGAMTLAIVAGVGAFLGVQKLGLASASWAHSPAQIAYGSQGAAAVAAYSEAIAADPTNYMTHYRRGVVYQLAGQYELALADFDQAVKLSPTPLSLEALGTRVSDSRHRPTHTLGLVSLLRTTRAEVLLRLNRPQDALGDLDTAIQLDPRKSHVYYSRGILRAMTGSYDAGIADFDVILARRGQVQWYFGRGLARYFKGDWSEAAGDFLQAVQRAQGNDAYLIWLAKAHLRAGIPLYAEQFAKMGPEGQAWPVVEAFMSDHDPAQFISGVRVGSRTAGAGDPAARCKAALFMGEWLTIRKAGAGARDMFAEAADVCQPLSLEHAAAAAELKREIPVSSLAP
jgi:tetratricopeptide (TPR) repeat protein